MTTKANIKIKEFSETDVWTVQQTLDERWGEGKIEIQLAEGRDQYGTAVPGFDNILDCIVTVLQVHADLERDKFQQTE